MINKCLDIAENLIEHHHYIASAFYVGSLSLRVAGLVRDQVSFRAKIG